MIPSITECLRLMDKYSMLENIKSHSIMVAKVAFVIADSLIKRGADLSMEKVIAGALLHDIGKTEGLRTGKDHVKIGVEICQKNGLYEIAELISEHVILNRFSIDSPYNEKEIVYYSDKRVNHDKVVSLEERLSYIIERYSKGDRLIADAIKRNFELCKKVEKKLFRELPFSPSEIPKLVQFVLFDRENGLIRWKEKICYFK